MTRHSCLHCKRQVMSPDPLIVLSGGLATCGKCGGRAVQNESFADSVDLSGYVAFYKRLTPNAYWVSPYDAKEREMSGKPPIPEGVHFFGEILWSVYVYLCLNDVLHDDRITETDWESYDSRIEPLYLAVLMRLVDQGVYTPVEDGRWFRGPK